MIQFSATIFKFDKKGEKTGWTYIEVPQDLADLLNPGVRKSFRVKGTLDDLGIKGVALLPMGDGCFILPLNAAMRKGIKKKEAAIIKVSLSLDKDEYQLSGLLVAALGHAPLANKTFYAMPRAHQNYYSKWVEAAKQKFTQEKRIVQIILSLERGLSYAEMLREQSAKNKLRN